MDTEPRLSPTQIAEQLSALTAQLDALRQTLEEHMAPDLDPRRQHQRLQAFGVQTNALVLLQGTPEQGGLLLVNGRELKLSPTLWPFLLTLAEAMQQFRVVTHPQRGMGFVTKEELAARARELTRHMATTFRPQPEGVKTYIGRLRKKLLQHGMADLLETQIHLGWRLSTLPEHIAIIRG
jgi:hypothetical protein